MVGVGVLVPAPVLKRLSYMVHKILTGAALSPEDMGHVWGSVVRMGRLLLTTRTQGCRAESAVPRSEVTGVLPCAQRETELLPGTEMSLWEEAAAVMGRQGDSGQRHRPDPGVAGAGRLCCMGHRPHGTGTGGSFPWRPLFLISERCMQKHFAPGPWWQWARFRVGLLPGAQYLPSARPAALLLVKVGAPRQETAWAGAGPETWGPGVLLMAAVRVCGLCGVVSVYRTQS